MFFVFLSRAPRSFSRASFARELADVFGKNEKKNQTTSVYRLVDTFHDQNLKFLTSVVTYPWSLKSPDGRSKKVFYKR